MAAMLRAALERRTSGRTLRLGVFGIVKNSGKTTTLVAVARTLREVAPGVRLGFLTTGHDGELVDGLTDEPKPQIEAPESALVATTRAALEERCVPHEVVRVTDQRTSLGPIVIARTLARVDVLLHGGRTARGAASLAAELSASGAQIVIIDGSMDRLAAASTLDSDDHVVLAIGAAYSPNDLDRVAQRATCLVDLFTAEVLHGPAPAEPFFLTARGGGTHDWNEVIAMARTPSPFGVEIRGGLTEDMLMSLLRARGEAPTDLVVRHPSCVLATPRTWNAWRATKGTLRVRSRPRLLGLTTSPYVPSRPPVDRAVFHEMIARRSPVPVIDILGELAAPGGLA